MSLRNKVAGHQIFFHRIVKKRQEALRSSVETPGNFGSKQLDIPSVMQEYVVWKGKQGNR
jgi:hypothetical protein